MTNKYNWNLENISLGILHKKWTCWKLCGGMSINWVYNLSLFHYTVFSWNTRPRKTLFCLKNSHNLPQKQITLSHNRLSGWGKCSSFPHAHGVFALFTLGLPRYSEDWSSLTLLRSVETCHEKLVPACRYKLYTYCAPLYCFDSANLFQLPFPNTFPMP